MLHDVAWFSIDYKNHCTCLTSDSCTIRSCYIKLFHSTGARITTMQLAKVVITSALVLAACAEGLPEGKDCVLKCIPDEKLSRLHT